MENNLEYVDVLFGFLMLIAMFGTQIALIKRAVAFIKTLKEWKGNTVRLLSFGIGAVLGALFLWPWIVMYPGYHVSVYVLTSVLFLLAAGLAASGDYDLKNEAKDG